MKAKYVRIERVDAMTGMMSTGQQCWDKQQPLHAAHTCEWWAAV